MVYDFTNFFYATEAYWFRCELPDRHPDYVSFSGSAYWDCGDRVIRFSDHWGIVKTCTWYLNNKSFEKVGSLCGDCFYGDFTSKPHSKSIN